MTKQQVWRIALILAAMVPASAQAAIKPNALFSDNAVLQRGVDLAVWGTTDQSGEVTVSVAGQSASAKPQDGKWRVKLGKLAAGGPHEMTIAQGSDKLTIKNVLVGEVWICGGQSNMQWSLQQVGAAQDIATATNDKIRLLNIPRKGAPQPQADVEAAWGLCTPQSVPGFTAVGYYFGRDLQKALDVPVGLINSNIGGTTAERWMSKESIDSNADLKDMSKPQGANDLYNAMVAPLAPYAIQGAIWYQGESNAGRAYQYRKLLPAMIKNWRDTFSQGDFPFLIVQLAPFKSISPEPIESDWAELREAQLMTVQADPKTTAQAVIIDAGDEKDIHPKKKEPVGARLALAARALAYDETIEYSGPVFDKLTVSGNKAIVSFTHVGKGLEVRPLAAQDAERAKVDANSLAGFTVAGADKKFYNATATIDGQTVVVSSDQVAAPVAVRYGWASYPVVNLWNKDGLPATPFRTDTFSGVTEGKK